MKATLFLATAYSADGSVEHYRAFCPSLLVANVMSCGDQGHCGLDGNDVIARSIWLTRDVVMVCDA